MVYHHHHHHKLYIHTHLLLQTNWNNSSRDIKPGIKGMQIVGPRYEHDTAYSRSYIGRFIDPPSECGNKQAQITTVTRSRDGLIDSPTDRRRRPWRIARTAAAVPIGNRNPGKRARVRQPSASHRSRYTR